MIELEPNRVNYIITRVGQDVFFAFFTKVWKEDHADDATYTASDAQQTQIVQRESKEGEHKY